MQLSFFDHAMQYQGGKKSMKFLNEMYEIIPFESIEEILIEKRIYKPNKSKTGRPSISAKILVGSLFLDYQTQWRVQINKGTKADIGIKYTYQTWA